MKQIKLGNLRPSLSELSPSSSELEPDSPKYFWSDKGKLSYYIAVKENRENLMKKVEEWYSRSSETLAFILPLFTQGMENLQVKILEINSSWEIALNNFNNIVLNDEIYANDLDKYNLEEEYKNLFKDQINSDSKTVLNEVMNQILPCFYEHKNDQRAAVRSSLKRIKLEVITPLQIQIKELGEGKFEDAKLIYKKAQKWIKEVNTKLHTKKKCYNNFLSVVQDNQTATVNRKKVKKDTLASLILLSISIGDLLNSLTEIENMLIEKWQIYESLINTSTSSLLAYHKKFDEIMPDYIFPELLKNNKQKFIPLKKDRIEIVYKITTLLKKSQILKAKEKFEMQEDFTFKDLCEYYRSEFLENFEDYIGKSWTLEDATTHKIFWLTISQDLYINIFALEVKNGRIQSSGKPIISDIIHKVTIKVDEKEKILHVSGKQPGSFFKKKWKIKLLKGKEMKEIENCMQSGKDFVKRKEV